jgi:hypothetical protein
MSREAFENWADDPLREWNLERCGEHAVWPDAYVDYYVQYAWLGWSARDAEVAALTAERDALRAEVTAWRERFFHYAYHPQDDCIERAT